LPPEPSRDARAFGVRGNQFAYGDGLGRVVEILHRELMGFQDFVHLRLFRYFAQPRVLKRGLEEKGQGPRIRGGQSVPFKG
jgi:hypothetical protein